MKVTRRYTMDHSTFVMLKPDALEAKLQEKILDMLSVNTASQSSRRKP
jgi:hypothetical protein